MTDRAPQRSAIDALGYGGGQAETRDLEPSDQAAARGDILRADTRRRNEGRSGRRTEGGARIRGPLPQGAPEPSLLGVEHGRLDQREGAITETRCRHQEQALLEATQGPPISARR